MISASYSSVSSFRFYVQSSVGACSVSTSQLCTAVERVFSQSGLIMRPNRARMSDEILEELVFL